MSAARVELLCSVLRGPSVRIVRLACMLEKLLLVFHRSFFFWFFCFWFGLCCVRCTRRSVRAVLVYGTAVKLQLHVYAHTDRAALSLSHSSVRFYIVTAANIFSCSVSTYSRCSSRANYSVLCAQTLAAATQLKTKKLFSVVIIVLLLLVVLVHIISSK